MTERHTDYYYNPDVFQTLSDHPIFSDVFNLQRTLDTERFETLAEAHEEGMMMLDEINQLLEDTDLLNKDVTITGLGVIMPLIAYDIETGAEVLRSETIDTSDDPLAEHGPVEGSFYGFHPVVTLDVPEEKDEDGNPVEGSLLDDETDDDIDELADTKFRITFHYRICTQEDIQLSNFAGATYALGNIGSTHLTFAVDKQDHDAALALNALADASHNAETALAVAKISELLTPIEDDTVFEIDRIRDAALVFHELEASQGIDMQLRDAVIDFVTARLGSYPDTVFTLETNRSFLRTNTEDSFSDTTIKGNYLINGLEFSPKFIIDEDGDAVRTGGEVISVTIPMTTDEDSSISAHVPLHELTVFKPYEKPQDY